jgi:hypothetical protein
VESEEEKIPYGGVITGEDADTSKTAITDRDKELFEKARLVHFDRFPSSCTWHP